MRDSKGRGHELAGRERRAAHATTAIRAPEHEEGDATPPVVRGPSLRNPSREKGPSGQLRGPTLRKERLS
jgi:hypothetical protein